MWTFFTSWITPTFLFVFVNVVIATIAVTSRFGTQKTHQHHLPPHAHGGPGLVRAPSLVDRVKSFNFSLYKFEQYPNAETVHFQPPVSDHPNPDPPPQLARAPSVLDRLKSIKLSSLRRSDSSTRETETPQPTEHIPEKNHEHLVNRSKSDSGSHTPSLDTSLRRRLKKSLSEKLAWASLQMATATPQAEEEEANIIEQRRPATSRPESAGGETPAGDDEEVDAKADDFINRFKQQLKLQRLESLLRYRDMIKGKK